MIKRFKKGAASFYIVAFSTLILVVIATGFATVIMSEISRTANDDLSQSAYDSALAGIEDAKVAYSNYRRCKEKGAVAAPSIGPDITCGDIINWVENDRNCSMVGHILGKIRKDDNSEVTIGGVERTGASGETTTNQAYTCVMLNTDLKDYRTTLDDNKRVQTLKASMGNGDTNDARYIKISWYSVARFVDNTLGNYAEIYDNRVIFPKITANITAPPIVEVQIVQTGTSFSLTDFDITGPGNRTNRATLFLTPTNNSGLARSGNEGNNYIGIWDGSTNSVSAEKVVKTNDHSVSNKAFSTYCDPNTDKEFYCNAIIELPDVINGGPRNNNTFMISIALPYQRPNTDFSIELCDNGWNCDSPVQLNEEKETGSESGQKKISNVQIAIDSTGRANDLYRRVEARVETADTTFGAGYPYYALEVLGDDGITKTMKVPSEYNFAF